MATKIEVETQNGDEYEILSPMNYDAVLTALEDWHRGSFSGVVKFTTPNGIFSIRADNIRCIDVHRDEE